jgi:vancomycin resistance protein YoaR
MPVRVASESSLHRNASLPVRENLLRRLPLGNPLVLGAGLGGAALLLMLGFVVIYQIAYAGRIYPGVRAYGYDLGGYSRQDAGALLQRALDNMAARPVTARYAEFSFTLSAQDLGLRTDLEPVLDAVYGIGRDGNPFQRFSTQFGLLRQGRSYEQASAAFDSVATTVALEGIARQVDRSVQDARLTVRGDFTVDLQPALSGRKLDLEGSRRRLEDVLGAGGSQFDLVVTETAPQNVQNNFDLARRQADQILSGPVVLNHDGKTWQLDRAQLASILRFNADLSATDAAYLDRAALEGWAKSLADAVAQTPQDARLSWNGGKLDVLRPSRNGVELDVKATVEAIVAQATGEHRAIPLPVNVTKPAVPMEDRDQLGIKELIKSSRTPFAGSVPAKQANITLAAKRLNGVVVPPGKTFSFNKELGPTTIDSGFQVGWGIAANGTNVKTVPSVAGGICQVATTLFHSVFWSGYQIEERNWHLYWISSYTSNGVIGLDATVDEDANLDFKFTNTTPTHLLLQSWIDDGLNINFALYGTKPAWTVKVDTSEKTDIEKADFNSVVYDEEQTMPEGAKLQVERAVDGFTITNTRHVSQPGQDERTLRLVSRYRPARNVILVGTGGKPPSGNQKIETTNPVAGPAKTAVPSTPVASVTATSSSAQAAPTSAAAAKPSAPTPTAVRPPSLPAPQAVATATAVPRPAAATPTPPRR